jgi:hypothetical protein
MTEGAQGGWKHGQQEEVEGKEAQKHLEHGAASDRGFTSPSDILNSTMISVSAALLNEESGHPEPGLSYPGILHLQSEGRGKLLHVYLVNVTLTTSHLCRSSSHGCTGQT